MADMIAEIRDDHTDFLGSCNACDKPWPCAAVRLADEHEQVRSSLAEPLEDTQFAVYLDPDAEIERRGRIIAVQAAELQRLGTWHGLMSVLDRQYPQDIFPTAPDHPGRDTGARLVSTLRELDKHRTFVEQLRTVADEPLITVAGALRRFGFAVGGS